MLLVSRDLQKSLRDGNADIKELADFLLKNNSVYELAYSLAELMQTAENYKPTKIVVSQEEWDTIKSIFRVRGIAEDGTPEPRGRKKKED